MPSKCARVRVCVCVCVRVFSEFRQVILRYLSVHIEQGLTYGDVIEVCVRVCVIECVRVRVFVCTRVCVCGTTIRQFGLIVIWKRLVVGGKSRSSP